MAGVNQVFFCIVAFLGVVNASFVFLRCDCSSNGACTRREDMFNATNPWTYKSAPANLKKMYRIELHIPSPSDFKCTFHTVLGFFGLTHYVYGISNSKTDQGAYIHGKGHRAFVRSEQGHSKEYKNLLKFARESKVEYYFRRDGSLGITASNGEKTYLRDLDLYKPSRHGATVYIGINTRYSTGTDAAHGVSEMECQFV